MSANEAGSNETLRLLRIIGDMNGDVVEHLAVQLALLNEESRAPITVLVCCQGGSADAAWAAYDLIRTSRAPVDTAAFGVVASASIIAYLAGERRIAGRMAEFKFHRPFAPIGNNAEANKDEAERVYDDTDHQHKRIIELCVARTKGPRSIFEKLMRKDARIDVHQASALGMVQEILSYRRARGLRRAVAKQRK